MATNETPATGHGEHTPEPWAAIQATYYYQIVGPPTSPTMRVSVGKMANGADAARAVACVNACAGMADPATTIRELREAVRVQREALETIAAMRCTDHANCRVFGASVESIATAALRAAGGGA